MGETVHGGLAELCRARAHQLVRIPDGVRFADAALAFRRGALDGRLNRVVDQGLEALLLVRLAGLVQLIELRPQVLSVGDRQALRRTEIATPPRTPLM